MNDTATRAASVAMETITAAITSKTKAIVAVEAFGHPGGMIELEQLAQKNELMLIEDCCEGFGGYVGRGPGMRAIGSFGRAGVFGFYPNKQITTGEGGMIVTDRPEAAELMRALRNQGRKASDDWLEHSELGYNYRISEVNCALGIEQMRRIESILERRES